MRRQSIPIKSLLLLLLTAAIWGTAFVAQSVGMDYVDPWTFNGVRSIIGGAVLLPVIFFADPNKGTSPSSSKEADVVYDKKDLILGGILYGVLLCFASAFQQFGVKYTSSVGKAGFITSCYIVLVPLLQSGIKIMKKHMPGSFLKNYTLKKAGRFLYPAIGMAVVGLFLLCIDDSFRMDRADILVLACALFFAVHILVIDYFSAKTEGVKVSCIQFFVCGILSLFFAMIFENPSWTDILSAWKPILYAGALSSGVGYTLQIIAQKNVNPTLASLILSLESCISAISGWIILGQKLGAKELFGCVIIFSAVILAQLPEKEDLRKEGEKYAQS